MTSVRKIDRLITSESLNRRVLDANAPQMDVPFKLVRDSALREKAIRGEFNGHI
jgi:hypothetical protein